MYAICVKPLSKGNGGRRQETGGAHNDVRASGPRQLEDDAVGPGLKKWVGPPFALAGACRAR